MKMTSLSLSALTLCLGLALQPAMASGLPAAVAGEALPSLAPMLERVLPAVVSVHVYGTQTERQRLPEEYKYFFGPNGPAEEESATPFEGLGSGVIIDADKGYVLTNNHVVSNADKIQVQLNDGREYEAKLLGRDEQSDIALLQLQAAKDLTAIRVADSDQLRVGDFAVAVGNPFGLGQTATSGIISALGRTGLNLEGLENFIQTDASINRGNSGGALLNLNGELIGINTAILAPGGGSIGIGFAIPSNMAQNLSKQLIEFGEVRRGMLGIKGSEMNADMAKAFKMDTQRGAFVNEVLADSAAARAGIKAGDVLVSLNGRQIESFAELRAKVGTAGPGKTVKIGLLRAGKLMEVDVTLQTSTEATAAQTLSPALQGATMSDGATDAGETGVKLVSVEPGSPAAALGLQKGDVIIGVNRERIASLADLRKVLAGKPQIVALHVVRGDDNIYLLLR
ncbi:serine endoprotease DegQ [Nissabacter sp. SGAir0207]|uniref:serine endoprotease DegQ n=1 Tax=Nissabacter sp. SGAir0207 TaxID=2126321 RepID=UPI0010CD6528|nr:serine endoprotease DegQ [Nissabacter sp. SGAir0207]QCR37343.1 serine endoprotease DegQ [Nissabacter sp. SGAir0207]